MTMKACEVVSSQKLTTSHEPDVDEEFISENNGLTQVAAADSAVGQSGTDVNDSEEKMATAGSQGAGSSGPDPIRQEVDERNTQSATRPPKRKEMCGRRIGVQIGAGRFGQVYKAIHIETGALEVVKTVPLTEQDGTEITIMESFPPHPHIIQLKHSYVSEHTIYIFLQFGGRTLDRYLHEERDKQSFSIEAVRSLFMQLVDAVLHLHSYQVCHRDIKPENILVDDRGWPRLADFGLAGTTTRQLTHLCGSLPFTAPEVLDLNNDGYNGALADCFSMGVLMYDMLFGAELLMMDLGWAGQNHKVLMKKPIVRAVELRAQLADRSFLRQGFYADYDPRITQALVSMLCPHPLTRPTLDAVRRALEADE